LLPYTIILLGQKISFDIHIINATIGNPNNNKR